jgi:acetyl-CoA carboxylase carboxyl transferase subunit beta
MTWIATREPPPIQRSLSGVQHHMPDHTWQQCSACQAPIYHRDAERLLQVCAGCGHHGAIGSRARLSALLDAGSPRELGAALRAKDALQFHDSQPYDKRLLRAQADAGESDALVALSGRLLGAPVTVACFEYAFMGGSMGSVVGERFALAVEAACDEKTPFVCITASGGARMQEGLFSLMQMAKTASCLGHLKRARLPFVSILTNPTMGGVSASFAFLADVVIAEPGALIGFAGPRVIEQTVREKLPAGFQRAEFLQAKGAVDLVIDRRQHRAMLRQVLGLLLPRLDDDRAAT